MRKLSVSLAALALLAGAGIAHASNITYTETVDATGSLGGVSFSDALVTLMSNFNTSGITTDESGGPGVNNTSATVNVSGIGSATFTIATLTFVNQASGAAGIESGTTAAPADDILDIVNSAFDTYGLTTSIGPLSGIGLFNSGSAFATTDGNFILTSLNGNVASNASPTNSAPTPEPAEFILTAMGMLGLPLIPRLRRR